jgi:hypothetical protein
MKYNYISAFRAQTEFITDHPIYWSSAQNFKNKISARIIQLPM